MEYQGDRPFAPSTGYEALYGDGRRDLAGRFSKTTFAPPFDDGVRAQNDRMSSGKTEQDDGRVTQIATQDCWTNVEPNRFPGG